MLDSIRLQEVQTVSEILDSISSNMRAGEITRSRATASTNVGSTERLASVLAGSAVALYGLTRRSTGGVAIAMLGGALLYRGATGHCDAYQILGINTADGEGERTAGVAYGKGIRVDKTVTVNRSPDELYRFWRGLENLPRFMDHLESVKQIDGKRSQWVAKGPAGKKVEWTAEIINEIPGELLAWRSLEGADVNNAGSVQFKPATGGRGTVVRVEMRYDPPGGALGAVIAKLFGEEPNLQVQEDLRRFKSLMEAGETPTTEGQSTGRMKD